MGLEKQYRTLDFPQAIQFLLGKLNIPTDSYRDIQDEEHDWAFMVAGTTKAQLLNDLKAEVLKAISGEATGGAMTRREFARNFQAIAQRNGWDYRGNRDWRANTIYGTNLRSAYAAGRYEQQTDPATLQARPYWQWQHNDSPQARPLHKYHLDGKVFRADDPFWQEMYPPDGYGCRCSVRSLNQRELERAGLVVETAPKLGTLVEVDLPDRRKTSERVRADEGFGHAPGKSRQEQRRQVLDNIMERLPETLKQQLANDIAREERSPQPPL